MRRVTLALLALLAVACTATQAQEAGCPAYDCNGDGAVDISDALVVLEHFGQVVESPTWTPSPLPTSSPASTSTITSTSSPVATPTATRTPTPTALPTGTLIDQIVADSTGNHDGCLDPSVDGYDWATHARPSGYDGGANLTPWYQVAWDHCSTETGGRVYLRNFTGWKLTSSGWQSIGSGLDAGQWGNYPISFVGSCAGWTVREEPDGLSFAPSPDRACQAHGWTWPRGSASGMLCVLVAIDMRGDGPFLVNVGTDAYDGDTYRGDIGIGAFRSVSAEWRRVYQSSCAAEQLATLP